MATGVTLYKSSDTSAPAINSTAGSLITLLDAILVGTAGVAYGSKPSAGWSKPYSGTNAADYQMAGGNQLYLQVDDNGPGAGGGKEARARGYEVMTAYNTGTGLFPTTAQLTNGVFIRKSAEASGGTTARTWVAVADDRTLYLFIDAGDSLGYTGFLFGDFYSFNANDSYRTMIVGRSTENDATATPENADRIMAGGAGLETMNGHYIARAYTGLGTSIATTKNGDSNAAGGATYLGGLIKFPNPADGGFIACPLYLNNGANAGANIIRRGTLRGFWQGIHGVFPTAFADGDTLASITGRTFIIIGRTYQNATSYFVVETSDTWDTNV